MGFVYRAVIKKVQWPGHWTIDHELKTIHLWANTPQEMTSRLNRAIELAGARTWKENALFTLNFDWEGRLVKDKRICDLDVGGWQMFGLTAFGVQVIGWVEGPSGDTLYWLQQRSKDRKVHPEKLDMMAGGGIKDGEMPRDAAIREAVEETGIDREYLDEHLEARDTVSYHLTWSHSNAHGSFPHVVYLFRVKLQDITPDKVNNEVDGFKLMREKDVIDELFGSQFKPILPIQWLGYFVGEEIIEIDRELIRRIHRDLT